MRRGVLLTGLLAVLLLVAIGGCVWYVASWSQIVIQFHNWAYVLATVAALRIPAVLAIWFWSKSGVVLYVALSAASIAVLLSLGYGISAVGIVGIILVAALVWPKWNFMSWGLSLRPRIEPAA